MRILGAIASLFLALSFAAEPAAAADRFFTSSDGVVLHYTEAGRGQTLVFVPGWTMPAWIWDAQISDFARRYHVVAFDPRSQGASAVAPDGHEPGRRGQDIAELLAQLGPRPVVLVGWSLGVLDTLAYVHAHGDGQLAGLVLVDNSVGEDPPPSGGGSGVRHPRHMTHEAWMRAFVKSMFHRPPSPAYIDRLTEATLHTPESAAAALLSYPVPRTYWRDAVYSVRRPVLYIVRPGLTGQATNLQAHDDMAESVVLRDVGHAMFVDDPAQFDAIVQSFIRRRVWP